MGTKNILVGLIVALALMSISCSAQQVGPEYLLFLGMNEIKIPKQITGTCEIRAYAKTSGNYINAILVDEDTLSKLDWKISRGRRAAILLKGKLNPAHRNTITIFSDADVERGSYGIYTE